MFRLAWAEPPAILRPFQPMAVAETKFYVAGGTLDHDASSYVERQADQELFSELLMGEHQSDVDRSDRPDRKRYLPMNRRTEALLLKEVVPRLRAAIPKTVPSGASATRPSASHSAREKLLKNPKLTAHSVNGGRSGRDPSDIRTVSADRSQKDRPYGRLDETIGLWSA